MAMTACQTTTTKDCKAYLAQETPAQAQAIITALAQGKVALIYEGRIVGALDANGNVTGCDPR